MENRGDAAESALAKQCAAGDALAKRANDAAKMTASKQRELENVRSAVVNAHVIGGVKKIENGGGAVLTPYQQPANSEWRISLGLSSRKRKSQTFFDKVKSRRQNQ